jgi:hypothetical protein
VQTFISLFSQKNRLLCAAKLSVALIKKPTCPSVQWLFEGATAPIRRQKSAKNKVLRRLFKDSLFGVLPFLSLIV